MLEPLRSLPPVEEDASAPPLDAREHFRLHLAATIEQLRRRVVAAFPSEEAAYAEFPFLEEYVRRAPRLAPGEELDDRIRARLPASPRMLPLLRLARAAALDTSMVRMFLCVGLVEEDERFGLLFESVQGTPGQRRPTFGRIRSWWSDGSDPEETGRRLRHLLDAGLLEATAADLPRSEWPLRVPAPLWEVLGGDAPQHPAPWLTWRPQRELTAGSALVLDPAVAEAVASLPARLEAGTALVVRGPRRNGRRVVCGAVARALGRGVLEIDAAAAADPARWRQVGPIATVLGALPVLVVDPGPGEMVTLAPLVSHAGPLAVVTGRHGGVGGPAIERAATLELALPRRELRRLLWQRALPEQEVAPLARTFRITSGHIPPTAERARLAARAAGRTEVTVEDVRTVLSDRRRRELETLAVPVVTRGDLADIAVRDETRRELDLLALRCAEREQLAEALGIPAAPGVGVRALFCGPSGTGKTLAARLLAAQLGMDLWRIDLAAVIDKYIGETEKKLEQVFARAEELDVMLLLDEGDALLGPRTMVQSSNDRHANSETNFLLQRIEALEAILVITTNAPQRIDSAFQRRLDVVIEFQPPDAAERLAIWRLHLPARHAVDARWLEEVAVRCRLTGGQIRNAALHAALLALEAGGPIGAGALFAGIEREHRRMGTACPLAPPDTAAAAGI